MTITINNEPHQWNKSRISHLSAFYVSGSSSEDYGYADISYTVKRGLVVEHGQIKPGGSVKAGEGMEIVVRVKK